MKEVKNPEKQINKFLRHTLACYLSYKKQKRHELARAVLRLGSTWADWALDFYGVRKNYFKPRCSRCGKLTVSQADNWSWQHTGLCLSCEHCEVDA